MRQLTPIKDAWSGSLKSQSRIPPSNNDQTGSQRVFKKKKKKGSNLLPVADLGFLEGGGGGWKKL